MAYRNYRQTSRRESDSFTAPAKFPGTCAHCQQPIAVGASMFAQQANGIGGTRWVRYHELCSPDNQRARRATLLDWSHATYLDEYRQYAWHDESYAVVPIVDAGASDSDLRQSCTDQNESSSGMLRWNNYEYLGRETPALALVRVVTHLCD